MEFNDIPKKYRPIPFWSWNEKLEVAETAEQVHKMNDVGIGGFFMHARGGLQTEYMSDEWFDNVESAINAAEETGMGAWAYDENGWPSGFGNGYVNGLGIEYQQKYLRMTETKPKENLIAKCGEHWFYYDVNPFYVDVLDKKVVAEFIDYAYKPYYEKYKNRIEGFFTDEPQLSRDGIPWSFVYDKEYKERYGDNINEHLEELFLPVGDYKNTRVKFWKMVTDLFSDSFMKQIYDKCNEWGLKIDRFLYQIKQNLPEHEGVTVWIDESAVRVGYGDSGSFEIRYPGGVCYNAATEKTEEFYKLVEEADKTFKTVKEYIDLMDKAPELSARDFNMPYKLLAEFNGVVLGGIEHQSSRSFEFTTWSYGNNALYHGHYFTDYEKAKEDFVVRSGLLQSAKLFNDKEMMQI